MVINDWIHIVAGCFILTSLLFGFFFSNYWFILTAFVGMNLLQYGFTKFCPLGFILKNWGFLISNSWGKRSGLIYLGICNCSQVNKNKLK